jgi:amino acid transporter
MRNVAEPRDTTLAMAVKELVFGRRLANREGEERKIGAFEGIPAMGLDGLGSSAYGPEAALVIMIGLGAASHQYIGPVMIPILLLLGILYTSYWQTIQAYPNNGGAYTVAKENLGVKASLLAAAALMVDYVLCVAVGISAGIAALVSAVPALHPYILPLCLGVLGLVALVNLRGTLDAGRLFAIPTYLFVAAFGLILATGLWKAFASGGAPEPAVPPPAMKQATEAVTLWLLLHAFASGCTAMTGVEAVSNGMSAFKEPRVRYGRRTLTGIVLILGLLLAGVAYLANAYEIGAMHQADAGYRSVLSQLASAAVGNGWLYYVAMGSLLCVLCLSANTSMVDFPRLCRMVATDGFLPRPFAIAGRRLVFSVGIIYLTVAAGALLIVFGGLTEHLIPLFAIGAFLTFTLSQTGMVLHWRKVLKDAPAGGRKLVTVKLAINAVGAATTGLALIVIVIAKFDEGGWVTLVALPAVVILLTQIRAYYDRLVARVDDPTPLDVKALVPPIVLVAIEDWNEIADKAISLALTLSPQVIGLSLVQLGGPDESYTSRLQERWQRNVVQPALRAGLAAPELVVLEAEYRAIHEPVLRYARQLELRYPDRSIAVLIPELIKERWYQQLLHTNRARRLRRNLLRHGGTRLTVINVPWYLRERPLPDVPTAA